MVWTAWGAWESWALFRLITPPAGAILASVRSLRAPPSCLLAPSGDEEQEVATVMLGTVVVGVVAVEIASWICTACHSPDGVLIRN